MQSKPEEEAAAAVDGLVVTHILAPRTIQNPNDYYQSVAINALLSILEDQSLSLQHAKVIEAIMSIFKTQGLKCVSFLPQASTARPSG